jgi:hypothetical protein
VSVCPSLKQQPCIINGALQIWQLLNSNVHVLELGITDVVHLRIGERCACCCTRSFALLLRSILSKMQRCMLVMNGGRELQLVEHNMPLSFSTDSIDMFTSSPLY